MKLRQAAFRSFCIKCWYFRSLSFRIFCAGCRVVRDEILRWRFRFWLGAIEFCAYFLLFSSDIEVLLGTKLLYDKRHSLPIDIESCFYKPPLQDISESYGNCGLICFTFSTTVCKRLPELLHISWVIYADFDVHNRPYVCYTITISYRSTFYSL